MIIEQSSLQYKVVDRDFLFPFLVSATDTLTAEERVVIEGTVLLHVSKSEVSEQSMKFQSFWNSGVSQIVKLYSIDYLNSTVLQYNKPKTIIALLVKTARCINILFQKRS